MRKLALAALCAGALVVGLVASSGEARAAELPLCPDEVLSLPPCGPGGSGCATFIEDLNLLVVVDDPAEEPQHCAPAEPLEGLDCEDPTSGTTPWLAGVLGLCDAPYGLALSGAATRLRVARLPGPSPELPPAPAAPREECRVSGCEGIPLPTPAPAPELERDPALFSVTGSPDEPDAVGRARLDHPVGPLPPGHARRIDRPPRAFRA